MVNDVERSLTAMSIGTLKAGQKREARRREMALDDTVMLFQGSVEGHAGSVVDTAVIEIEFDAPIYSAPGLNDSDLEHPHFSAGVHLENGSGVLVSAHVNGWTQDEEQDATTGATVEISAVAPGSASLVQFTANLHLTFRGLGAPLEDEGDMT